MEKANGKQGRLRKIVENQGKWKENVSKPKSKKNPQTQKKKKSPNNFLPNINRQKYTRCMFLDMIPSWKSQFVVMEPLLMLQFSQFSTFSWSCWDKHWWLRSRSCRAWVLAYCLVCSYHHWWSTPCWSAKCYLIQSTSIIYKYISLLRWIYPRLIDGEYQWWKVPWSGSIDPVTLCSKQPCCQIVSVFYNGSDITSSVNGTFSDAKRKRNGFANEWKREHERTFEHVAKSCCRDVIKIMIKKKHNSRESVKKMIALCMFLSCFWHVFWVFVGTRRNLSRSIATNQEWSSTKTLAFQKAGKSEKSCRYKTYISWLLPQEMYFIAIYQLYKNYIITHILPDDDMCTTHHIIKHNV